MERHFVERPEAGEVPAEDLQSGVQEQDDQVFLVRFVGRFGSHHVVEVAVDGFGGVALCGSGRLLAELHDGVIADQESHAVVSGPPSTAEVIAGA